MQTNISKTTLVGMKLWLYVSKPFRITKVLELLYTFDWLWYAILSYLPGQYVSGGLFTILRSADITALAISIIITLLALSHVVALWWNIIWLRRANILINVLLLTFITSRSILIQPLPSGVGYLIILICVTIFVFWRMDITQ